MSLSLFDTVTGNPFASVMEVRSVLKAKATRNHAGIVIQGTGADLEELYCALNTLMAKRDGLEDGEVPQSGTNLRISGLCHDIRRALPVPFRSESGESSDSGPMSGPASEAGKILSFETGKELPFDLSLDDVDTEEAGELEDFDGMDGFDEDYIDAGELDEVYDDPEAAEELEELEEPDEMDPGDPASPFGPGFHSEPGEHTGLPLQVVCEFRIMWPEVIFVCLLLREYLGSRYDLEYNKKWKGLDWTLEWVAVRRFQIVVLECLCLHVSPAQARSIRKIFMESCSNLSGYCTQYVDKLTNTFAGRNAEQRLKTLSQLPRKLVAQGSDYSALDAEIRNKAGQSDCPPWELSLVDDTADDFVW